MTSASRRVWVGWVLPVALGAAGGLGARAVYEDLEGTSLLVAEAATTTSPEPKRHKHPSELIGDGTRIDLGVTDPEAQSSESLEDVLAEITELEQRIDEMTDGAFLGSGDDREGWFEPDQETLREWAACGQLPVDLPAALFRNDGTWFSEEGLEIVELTDDEREALSRATDEFGRDLHQRVVALHEDIVDKGPAGDRPTYALIRDLQAMQSVWDPDGLDRKLVALERAGEPPPEHLGSQEMVPFYRELIRIGDDLEQTVATVLGKDRAHRLRRSGNGWGARISNPPQCE